MSSICKRCLVCWWRFSVIQVMLIWTSWWGISAFKERHWLQSHRPLKPLTNVLVDRVIITIELSTRTEEALRGESSSRSMRKSSCPYWSSYDVSCVYVLRFRYRSSQLWGPGRTSPVTALPMTMRTFLTLAMNFELRKLIAYFYLLTITICRWVKVEKRGITGGRGSHLWNDFGKFCNLLHKSHQTNAIHRRLPPFIRQNQQHVTCVQHVTGDWHHHAATHASWSTHGCSLNVDIMT